MIVLVHRLLSQAVASMDDVLRVFYGGSASEKTLVPTLKHPRQKNVACVKWRPLSASGLAVAAQDGVVLWKVKTLNFLKRLEGLVGKLVSVSFMKWSNHSNECRWIPTLCRHVHRPLA